MDIALVRWPCEAGRRQRLAGERVPRLVLVEDGALPPPPAGCLEDWIRVPASEDDVRARMTALSSRVDSHSLHHDVDGGLATPALDPDGVLRLGSAWVSLPPVESRLTAALLDRLGAVVSRDALGRAGWPESAPRRNALDVHVLRLRRRIAPVSLAIRTVRSRGYLLEVVPAQQRVSGE